jgi:PAS domain S-box-containing protein
MKAGFLEKLIERLDRIDPGSLQTHFLHLAHERGLLETIFQSIQEGIIVVDGEGRINYANRAAEQLMGFTLERVRGRPILRYLSEIDWDRVLDLDAVEWSKMLRYEIEVRHPEQRFLSFYVVPLAAVNSSEKGAVVILRDITRDRENNATIVESERMNAIRMLAAGVAHEIGNPLNALHIHLQLLERELQKNADGNRREALDLVAVAKNEVKRLDVIITQFLRAIRPSQPQLNPSAIDAILKETLTLLRQEVEDRRIHVEIDCPEPLPPLRIDKDQMKQAFFNVIKNALEAMSEGGKLTISLTLGDRFASIAFRDTGGGIAPEHFRQVFEPYYTTKPSGSGLGLMIVQRIVQEHGGKIDIQSAPKSGTTVTILLPLNERRMRLLKPADKEARAKTEEESA